jgi:hypothetical protein
MLKSQMSIVFIDVYAKSHVLVVVLDEFVFAGLNENLTIVAIDSEVSIL